MRHLIVGIGEVGGALKLVLNKEEDVQFKDIEDKHIALPIDFMHVAIRYTDDFVKIVKKYIRDYKPKHVIVYSSVPVGTTKKLGKNVVHSPVEGLHPHLKQSLGNFTRFIGGTSEETLKATLDLWSKYARCKIVRDSRFTEFLKLYSTSTYGINIVWADYGDKWAKKLGMDYALIKEFNTQYNELYHRLKRPQFKRYVLNPPHGRIGGHCITPNAELLDGQEPHEMLKMIKDMQ